MALADLSGHKVDIDRNVKEGPVGRSVKSGVRVVSMYCIFVQNCLKAHLVNEVC